MKLLLVVSSLGSGGAERVLSLLANRWCERHEVVVVTIRSLRREFFVLDGRVRRVSLDIERERWWRPWPYVKVIAAIRRLIKEERPDYVVSFVIKTNIFTLLAARGLGARVVACEHSVISRSDIDLRQDALRRILYPRAYRIGVLTESIAEEFRRKYPRVPAGLVSVLPNPVVAEAQGPSDYPSLAGLFSGSPENFDIVVSLGRLHEVKDYASLIEAFALASATRPRARLAIFGEGPERPALERAVRSAGLASKVLLPGATSAPASVLVQARLFAMSSRFEGFPMALVEALSLGLPAAAFDSPGVRDLVRDGENGLLAARGNAAELAAAIGRLLDDPELRRRLGAAGKASIAKFSPEAVDRIWFEEVLTSRRRQVAAS